MQRANTIKPYLDEALFSCQPVCVQVPALSADKKENQAREMFSRVELRVFTESSVVSWGLVRRACLSVGFTGSIFISNMSVPMGL